ncbi:MAG: hypothetical protein Q4G30_03900 [Actinomycetaceae bacterium]|nr:hypothetical protein [Actinomycetaceae bacterium]
MSSTMDNVYMQQLIPSSLNMASIELGPLSHKLRKLAASLVYRGVV